MTTTRIVGLCGSLRAQSLNRSALHAAAACMPQGMRLDELRYDDVPLFSQDTQDQGMPDAVVRIADAVRGADAVLIACPEYNFSVPGVLKNAIDWLSRSKTPVFKYKPVAIISATQGPLGGGRCQYELRKVLGCLEALVLARPEVFIGMAHTKFDVQGQLVDEPTRKVLTDQMQAFGQWIERLQ